MKKNISLALCLLLIAGLFAGCGRTAPAAAPAEKRLNVVTTIFPEYDWVRQIAGDKADVTMLLDNGVDLHSYQPTADDIIKISTCDMFIYVGGESDDWVEDVLRQASNRDMAVVNLLEALGESVKEEEVVEGMEAEEEEEEEEEPEYDEHVWLSLRNAAVLCGRIADELGRIDAGNAGAYRANADAYIAKLNALDGEYKAAIDAAGVKTLLFGDRFPFRYLADDYGLQYYAAFTGCSAETEASFETVIFLANKVDELGLHAIMQIESADGKIAETIRETTQSKDQKILTLDSMQSVTAKGVADGADYLAAMEQNMAVLREALS